MDTSESDSMRAESLRQLYRGDQFGKHSQNLILEKLIFENRLETLQIGSTCEPL